MTAGQLSGYRPERDVSTKGGDQENGASIDRLAAFPSPFAHHGAVVPDADAKTGGLFARHLWFTDYLHPRPVEFNSIEAARVCRLLQLHDRCDGHDAFLIKTLRSRQSISPGDMTII